MLENEAISLAQAYLNHWRITVTGLRTSALIDEPETLMELHWCLVFSLPPLPEEFQAIDPDPALVLCVDCLSRKVRRLGG